MRKSILKLSGKPINAFKEKKHLTYDEMKLSQELLRILRNSHHLSLLPTGVPRKGFIRAMLRMRRWVIVGRFALGNRGDYDPDKLSFYSGMRKGAPLFDNNRIRVYKTRAGAERAIKSMVDSGLLFGQKLSLAHIWLLTGD